MALIRQVLVEGYLSKMEELMEFKSQRTRFVQIRLVFMMSEDHVYNGHEDESIITASKYLRQRTKMKQCFVI
jgi:hypothetical protein